MLIRIQIDAKRDSIESLSLLKNHLTETAQEICIRNNTICSKCPDKYFCKAVLSSAEHINNYIIERTNKICLK